MLVALREVGVKKSHADVRVCDSAMFGFVRVRAYYEEAGHDISWSSRVRRRDWSTRASQLGENGMSGVRERQR